MNALTDDEWEWLCSCFKNSKIANCTPLTFFWWFAVLATLISLLFLAIFLESRDYGIVSEKPHIKDNPTQNTWKTKQWYHCHAANEPLWKSVYLATFIATFLIAFFLYFYGIQYDISLILIIFFSIFVPVYFVRNFKNYHYYQPICEKTLEDEPTNEEEQ